MHSIPLQDMIKESLQYVPLEATLSAYEEKIPARNAIYTHA
jgi:hypothetical protein